MKKGYYCEACGAPVKAAAETCPLCGRSFLGVRCPRCGRDGVPEDFVHGCPDCGFIAEHLHPHGAEEIPGRRARPRPDWPASRYWILSGLLLVAATLSLSFCFKG